MSRMKRKNVDNIKRIFEENTGVELKKSVLPVKKLVVLAAAAVCCFAMAAFAYPLFTPLDGDELTLSASYEGAGIVKVYVENGSDKNLEFQQKTKLIQWVTGQEAARLEGDILFADTRFPAHTSGIMTVDLSGAYDIAALEQEEAPQSYYLLLTNHDFLFGHDWMCSFTFKTAEQEIREAEPHLAAKAEPMEIIEESLRFYFQDSYQNQVVGLNEANFDYLQKVDECIKRFEGKVIAPLAPTVMVSGPSTSLDPQPYITAEGEAVDSDWVTVDGYHRLIGGKIGEKALAVTVMVPSADYEGSVSAVPLIYTLVYRQEDAKPENTAFFYGQFHSFEELESCKVFEDSHYAIFDITGFLYTDLDGYIDYLQKSETGLRIDEQVRRQMQEIYNSYRESLGERIAYRDVT